MRTKVDNGRIGEQVPFTDALYGRSLSELLADGNPNELGLDGVESEPIGRNPGPQSLRGLAPSTVTMASVQQGSAGRPEDHLRTVGHAGPAPGIGDIGNRLGCQF